MRKFGRLEAISFTTGFSLLAFELVAARLLAPSIGSSTYIWTSVIGVIIASLSLGFFAGGRLADARAKQTDLVWLLCLCALAVALTQLIYIDVLTDMVAAFDDPRVQAVVASLWLFAPTSFLTGMTSPYLVKLNVTSLKTSGQAVAGLDALNALGGIAGTFVTGFFLFGYVGSRETLGIVVVLLLAASWLLVPRYRVVRRVAISLLLLVVVSIPAQTIENRRDIDTPSAHYQVINFAFGYQQATGLIMGPGGIQSGVYPNNPSELVFWYTRELARLTLADEPKSVLVLGGGAFTLPQYLAEQLPDSQVDVVEIDPELKKISEMYFNYKNPSNVRLIFDDARTYVQTSPRQYDVVVVDVYGDASIPFSLITKEYGQALAKRVKPGGTVLVNIVGGLRGPCKAVLGAVDAAYRQEFPYALYSNESNKLEARANYIVRYTRTSQSTTGMKQLPDSNSQLYTDNYAPAERLYYDCEQIR